MSETNNNATHDEQTPPQAQTPSPAPAGGPPRRYEPQSFQTFYSLYLWFTIGSIGLLVTLILSLFAFPALIAAVVFAAILLFRTWDQIQDGEARTSPGLAVGLMFVPLFNLYWVFVAILGLAKDLNRYMDERDIGGHRVNENLAMAMAVLMPVSFVCSIIPLVNIAVGIAQLVVALLTMNEFKKSSIAIAESGA